MTSRIRVLDEQTINQIAAGEVIENPSSVVKELVENALDAGATEINVDIIAGGRQLISVSDNGCGMNPDDALLCLERHGTSKISQVDDIMAIETMGFRGEAIPSIASISKFTLLTRMEGSDSKGTMVVVDGGKIVRSTPAECQQGTKIEVKSLFFNVPVRRKFQRSPTYDANEIHKVLLMQALANPAVAFRLRSNQEEVFYTPVDKEKPFMGQLKERIDSLLGQEGASPFGMIDVALNECQIQGYIAPPNFTRHNRSGQYLFINKRAVTSWMVSGAVRDGFGSSLGTHRHPIFVLHLTLPGGWVDVNVHPQKKEVRLRQENKIREALVYAVQETLKQSKSETPYPIISEAPVSFVCETPASFADFAISYPPSPSPPVSFSPPVKEEWIISEETDQKVKVIGTINRYILIEPVKQEDLMAGGICFVDQRNAHARIIYEHLLASQSDSKTIESQHLLFPHTFQKSAVESAQIREVLPRLQQLGVLIKCFGNETFVVDAVPKVFGRVAIETLVMELTASIQSGTDGDALEKERCKATAAAASRAAISVDKKLTIQEAQSLVDQLMACENPYHCPLGKLTIVHFSEANINKCFQKRSL